MIIIYPESWEQPSEIPHSRFQQSALRGEFSSSSNGSNAPMSARLCMLVYVRLRSDVGASPMQVICFRTSVRFRGKTEEVFLCLMSSWFLHVFVMCSRLHSDVGPSPRNVYMFMIMCLCYIPVDMLSVYRNSVRCRARPDAGLQFDVGWCPMLDSSNARRGPM